MRSYMYVSRELAIVDLIESMDNVDIFTDYSNPGHIVSKTDETVLIIVYYCCLSFQKRIYPIKQVAYYILLEQL